MFDLLNFQLKLLLDFELNLVLDLEVLQEKKNSMFTYSTASSSESSACPNPRNICTYTPIYFILRHSDFNNTSFESFPFFVDTLYSE